MYPIRSQLVKFAENRWWPRRHAVSQRQRLQQPGPQVLQYLWTTTESHEPDRDETGEHRETGAEHQR